MDTCSYVVICIIWYWYSTHYSWNILTKTLKVFRIWCVWINVSFSFVNNQQNCNIKMICHTIENIILFIVRHKHYNSTMQIHNWKSIWITKSNGYNFNVAGPLGYHNYEKFITKTPSLEDANTLLLLYEASYLAFGDEEKLDVARTFSAKALKQLMPFMLPHLREGVAHSLELPLHWRASRLETRWFIDYYARDRNMCPLLLQFAEIDFNQVQYEHQKDLAVVTRYAWGIDFSSYHIHCLISYLK
jgi:hypothetical protein